MHSLKLVRFLPFFFLIGCSVSKPFNTSANSDVSSIRGLVRGGQQPVSGASIQLYAVGTNGDGSAASPLLSSAAITDAAGNFQISGTYTCPSAGTLVYIVATGGNPGLATGTTNASISLTAALGACGGLSATTFVNIDEVITVATVNALAAFMTGPSAIGSSTGDAASLASAFALAAEYANTATGLSPGLTVPAGTLVPVNEINTLANVLAACVNTSGGTAGDGSNCGNLFSLTSSNGITPATDTVTAALHLASNPTLSTVALFGLAAASPPFQPSLPAAPYDFSVGLVVTSGLAPSSTTVSFASSTVGALSGAQTLTLTNNGPTAIALLSFSINGMNAADFTQTNNCASSLASAASCTLELSFTPSARGNRIANLSVTNDSASSPLVVELSGIGTALAAPQLVSVSQTTFTVGSASTPLTLAGTGFTPTSVVYVNNIPQTTTFISGQSVTFTLGSQFFSTTGTVYIYAVNSNRVSNNLTVQVVNPVPTLTSINPTTVVAGAPNFQLNVIGTGLQNATTVVINGVSHSISSTSGTTATIGVNASEVAATGTLNVTLVTPLPGGGTSAALPLQVIAAENRVRTLNYPTLDIVADPVRNLLYASVSSTSPTNPNSIVAIDPLQGTVVTAQTMDAQPGQLAVSDDGTCLYVVVGTTGQVSRLLLPTLTPDIQFSVGSFAPQDMQVAPGQPHTLAVSAGGVKIFDDAVVRPLAPPGTYLDAFGPIVWGNDATVLYSSDSSGSGGPEFIFSVDQNGPTLAKTVPAVVGDFDRRLIYDKSSGLIYDGYGFAADAASGTPVGRFNVGTTSGSQNAFAIDAGNGRAFFLNINYGLYGWPQDIRSFDTNTYLSLNALEVPGFSGGKIVRWGASGLAVGGGAQIYLVDGSFVSPSGISSAVGGYAAASPVLTAISPQTVSMGSPDVTVTIAGAGFTQAAVVTWNSKTLPSTWQSSTQITATIPASILTQALTSNIVVSNGPGTESGNGFPFAVLPTLGPNLQISALPLSGQDMAVDPVRGLLYVAGTNPESPNASTVTVVDPATSTIQKSVFTGNQPRTLGVSDDGKYLYSGFQTVAGVKRYLLPDLSLDLTIPLYSGGYSESYAGEIKVAPGHNQTFAVTMGNHLIEPQSAGGIGIFDGATERPKTIPVGGNDLFKLAWNKDGTRLFANSDPCCTPQNAGILTVDSTGITSTIGVSNGLGSVGLRPHYDSGTDLVYSDGGNITSFATGNPAGYLKAAGAMVPDSTLNRAFFLQRDATGNGIYDLVIFDLRTQIPLKTIPLSQISGYPTQLVRWGTQGLAFLTDNNSPGYGMLYILQGSDISGVSTPPPGAITLSPASVVEGAATGATVTVIGSNFISGSTVVVNGTPHTTTFVSATQLSFTMTAADQAFPTYLSVLVTNPGGATSPTTSLAVLNPVPAVSSLGSSTVLINSSATLAVLGTGFVPSTGVRFNGSARTTTYVSPTQVTFTPNPGDLAAATTYPISVANPAPGGGVSNAVLLQVNNPVPAIGSLSPVTVAVGSASRSINVYGMNFVPSTVIQVNGTPRTTTYVSSGSISAVLTAADFATTASVSLVAVNPGPGGGTSAAASIAVNAGPLAAITLSPNAVLTGATTPTTIAITGSNFTPSTVVYFGASLRTPTLVSSTQLTFQLTVADQVTAGNYTVTVADPPSGSSASANLTLAPPTATPVITALTPSQFVVGSSGNTLSVNGSGFNSASVIYWNGTPLAGYFSFSSSYISAPVPASLLASAGTATITVSTPTASPSLSNAVSIGIVNPPIPTLTSMTPSVGPINAPFTATMTGTGFTANSVVSVNGTALPTSFVSSVQLTAAVPASQVTPGNLSFTVTTPAPGGGTSPAVTFTSYIPIANNSMVYNQTNGLFYLSIPSSAGAPYANSIVSLDPVTGALGTPIFVGSEPDKLALTGDGRYLWVGLDGAYAVRKVDLVAGTAGLQFPLVQCSRDCTNTSSPIPYALAAVPGQTDSVLVGGGSSSGFYGTLAIYDNGAPRTLQSGYGGAALQVDGSRNEVYVAGGPYGIYTYNGSGLTPKTSISSPWRADNTDGRLKLVSGRIYTDYATVYDSETATLLGTFALPANYNGFPVPTAIDPTLGLAFLLDAPTSYPPAPTQIQLFNLSDFSPSGSAVIPVNVVTDGYGRASATSFNLSRWGANGLAFRSAYGVYALRSNLVRDLSTTPADLSVTLNASGTSTTGTQTTYVATIANAGPSTTTENSLVASLPSTGVLVSATPSSGTCSTGSVVTCNLGTLANGGTATLTLVVNQLTPGPSTMTVQVTASQTDSNLANNQDTSTTTVTGSTFAPTPILQSLTPSAILAGSSDTTITVAGTGFLAGTTVQLDGTTIQTNVLSTTQLTATVPAASLASLSWHAVTISNPSPGGGVSAAQPLSVFNLLKAGVNHILYDPFSRQIFATMGSSMPQGNSIAALAPSTGIFSTPVYVGSEPTRMALTDDGKVLYVLVTGASQIVRYDMLTQQPQFGFSLTNTGWDFAIQTASENTLAVTGNFPPLAQIVDVDPTAHTATFRPSTSMGYGNVSPQFLDSSRLALAGANYLQYGLFAVTTTGVGPTPSSYGPGGSGPFKLSHGVAYSTNGGVTDLTVNPGRQLGTFPINSRASYPQVAAGLAPDPSLERVFYLANFDGTNWNSTNASGIVAFNTNTFLPTGLIPLNISRFESMPIVPQDVIRWGQDGIAALTGSGNIYLLRGAAVVPQLLQTSTPPVLSGSSPGSILHGSGNIVITITGTNFLPAVAVTWNGSYRTTNWISSTQVTVDVPAADLISPGIASIAASNPGSINSEAINLTIN